MQCHWCVVSQNGVNFHWITQLDHRTEGLQISFNLQKQNRLFLFISPLSFSSVFLFSLNKLLHDFLQTLEAFDFPFTRRNIKAIHKLYRIYPLLQKWWLHLLITNREGSLFPLNFLTGKWSRTKNWQDGSRVMNPKWVALLSPGFCNKAVKLMSEDPWYPRFRFGKDCFKPFQEIIDVKS